MTLGTLKLLNVLGVYEIIYGIKAGGFSGHYIKMKCHNIIEKDNCSQQVLKFVTIKTEQSKGVWTSPCQKKLLVSLCQQNTFGFFPF